MEPVGALERLGFLLERSLAPTHRVRASLTTAWMLPEPGPREAGRGRLTKGTQGPRPEDRAGVREASAGEAPGRLHPLAAVGAPLRGDCHLHSDQSDGGGAQGARAPFRLLTGIGCAPSTTAPWTRSRTCGSTWMSWWRPCTPGHGRTPGR
ncbi:hypothetical protein [Streptomyces sp. NWU339]|uniref:hypothetical protein n=1 Tax=Streptomyces sp. NWU339 TaxID=2185284 RepID=UPI00269CD5DC|nr:hypothetical protein [Streptomyces sp. NWU339]